MHSRHPTKPGTVPVPGGGKLARDIAPGTLRSVLRQARVPEKRCATEYVVVIEKADDGSYSAYVPDLPGCVSCGDSPEEAEEMIRQAIQGHLAVMREHGDPILAPRSTARTVRAA